MPNTHGGWSAQDEWDQGGWSRFDALTIIVTRFQWIIFIISIIVGILIGIFVEDKVKYAITKNNESESNQTRLPENIVN